MEYKDTKEYKEYAARQKKEYKTLTYAGYKFQTHDDGSLTLDEEINDLKFVNVGNYFQLRRVDGVLTFVKIKEEDGS